jgi:hypothetical protein
MSHTQLYARFVVSGRGTRPGFGFHGSVGKCWLVGGGRRIGSRCFRIRGRGRSRFVEQTQSISGVDGSVAKDLGFEFFEADRDDDSGATLGNRFVRALMRFLVNVC